MPLDPRADRLLKLLAASGGAGLETAEDRRRSLAELSAVAGGPPVEAEVHEVAVTGPSRSMTVRRYKGEAYRGGAVLFVHGGGWVAGGLDTHDGFCRRLAAASGAEVLALDYRLAPEHPFPAGLEDVSRALAWARSGAAGVDPDQVLLAGDSAGGTLATTACLRASKAERPLALLLICPILDLAEGQGSRHAFGDGFFLSRATLQRDVADYLPGGVELDDPRVSPLRTAALAGAPPTFVHLAEFDPFRDEGLRFVERLNTVGVEAHARVHRGMIHYFYALCGAIPAAEPAIAEMGRDIRTALSQPRR